MIYIFKNSQPNSQKSCEPSSNMFNSLSGHCGGWEFAEGRGLIFSHLMLVEGDNRKFLNSCNSSRNWHLMLRIHREERNFEWEPQKWIWEAIGYVIAIEWSWWFVLFLKKLHSNELFTLCHFLDAPNLFSSIWSPTVENYVQFVF